MVFSHLFDFSPPAAGPPGEELDVLSPPAAGPPGDELRPSHQLMHDRLSTKFSPKHTAFPDFLKVDSRSCMRDYELQLCPHNWWNGNDGDSCRAPDSYPGPCESVLHGMSALSPMDKHNLAKKCRTDWPCKGFFDTEEWFLDPSVLNAKHDGKIRLTEARYYCKYDKYRITNAAMRTMKLKQGTQDYNQFARSFVEVENDDACAKQCTLAGPACWAYTFFDSTQSAPLKNRWGGRKSVLYQYAYESKTFHACTMADTIGEDWSWQAIANIVFVRKRNWCTCTATAIVTSQFMSVVHTLFHVNAYPKGYSFFIAILGRS